MYQNVQPSVSTLICVDFPHAKELSVCVPPAPASTVSAFVVAPTFVT